MTHRKPAQRLTTPAFSTGPGRDPAAARRWLARLLIAAVVVAAYANALRGPFVFDDRAAIEENATIRSLGAADVLRPPPETPVSGRPLANITFAVNFATNGLHVFGYHVVNVGLHVLTAITLMGLLRRTLVRTALPAPLASHIDPGAAALTLVWAVHPLNSETVNYITQRTESLMGLFFLLAIYSAIRATDDARPRWLVLTLASAIAAVTSKETAVVLPIVIVLWDRAFAFPTWRDAWARRRGIYAAAAAAWVFFAIAASALPAQRSLASGPSGSRWMYLLNQAEIIPQYLRLSVWPHGLIFDYGPMQALAVSTVLPGVVLLAGLIAAIAYAARKSPWLAFWGAWFFITLAPASSLVPIASEVGAERRMYLPLIGVINVLGFAAVRALAALPLDARVRPRLAAGVVAATIAGLAATTVLRNADYQSAVALWQTVLERRPHARAHEHLSVHLRDDGRVDEMIAQLRLAAAASPNSRHALAAALLEQGKVAESIVEFNRFVDAHPTDRNIAFARRQYADALQRSGDHASAIAQLRLALRDQPGDLRTHIALGDALRLSGDPTAAIDAYREADRVAPRNLAVLSSLGVLLADTGQATEAMAILRRALDVEPRQVPVRIRLTQLLLIMQDFTSAEREARALVDVAPRAAEAHNLLGVSLASQKRLEPARAAFAEALRLDPSHADARQNLARITSMLKAELAPP